MPDDKARNAFRQSLHRLRTSLGEPILPQDRERVAIGSPSLLQIDRSRFLAAIERERWTEAIAAYQGDFLEGFELDEPAFDQWADAERVRLRAKLQTALKAAAKQAQESGDLATAIPLAQRLASTTPYDEESALFESTLLVAAGRSPEALASANAFAARLRDDLDLPTPPAIRTLVTRLERGSAGAATVDGNRSSTAAATPTRLPFVGRESEMARLLAAVAELRAERGSTFLITGDAGIGKSRLLDEFAERARAIGGVRWLRGRERAATASLAYAGVADALRAIVRAPGIGGASRHLLAEAARLLPELRDAFDLPAAPPLEDEAGRIRFFEGIAAVIDAAAYEQPLSIVIDDAHHASVASLDLIGYLSGRLRSSPVLLIVALRADRNARPIADRLRTLVHADDGGTGSLLEIGPLADAESRNLARAALQKADARDADVDRIAQQSLGKPFLVIELARRLRSGSALSENIVAIRDVLWTRLQAASPSQRRVFFAAALLERVASLRLLAAASHLPEPAALDAAQSLTRDGLLRETDAGFVIAHDTTSSFVSDASGIAGRALLAGWAADALAAEDDRTDAELAALYALAGRTGLAFTHARAGAFAAAAVGAAPEATRLLGIALTFAPDDTARAEIESLLAAFGAGAVRLIGSGQVDSPVETEDIDDVEVEATPMEPVVASPRETKRARRPRTTKGQWYMSVALSIITVLLGVLVRRQTTTASLASRARPDSLLLVQRDASGQNQLRVAAVSIQGETAPVVETASGVSRGPSWIDSIAAPWSDALVSPDLRLVSLARVTPRGKDVFIISADRRDTIALVSGAGDNAALDWSPDSRALLVARARTLADGSYHSDLLAYPAARDARPVPIDTSAARSVTEAKWSPLGSSIAWAARSAATRQQDVFVARADGGNIRVISESPADERGVAWSPDGSLVTFTSTRTGAPRLYTYDIDANKLWSTSDRDGEDHARYSPDGRLIAFESTRDGDAAVYVRPPLGGTARRVSPLGAQFSVAGWLNERGRYVDRLRIIGASSLTVGDTVRLTVLGIEPAGGVAPGVLAEWRVSGTGVVALPASSPLSVEQTLIATSEGTAIVVASIPGWRTDTLALAVGSSQGTRLDDAFAAPLDTRRWIPLGEPLPAIASVQGTPALVPSGDFEWESGVLSRESFELRPGLTLHARLFAPFGGRATPATLAVSIVPAVADQALDRRAPRFTPTVGASWDGQSGGFTFTVGRESNVDASTARQSAPSHTVDIRIEPDGAVVFQLDGAERWRSSLRFVGDTRGARFQLWIASRAAGATVAVSDLSLRQPPKPR
jgi:DNA-binding SARP family transcriptional activator